MIANIKRYAMRNINLKPMAQQTAVEWLAERVVIPSENGKYHIEVPYGDGKIDVTSIIKQAKQMEKEQRIQDYNAGYTDAQCNHINDAENYVNEINYINSKEK